MVVAEALRREVEEPVGVRFVCLTPYAEILEAMEAVPAAMRSRRHGDPARFLSRPLEALRRRPGRVSGNSWRLSATHLHTIGGWWTYRKTIQADLERIREARGTTQPVPPEFYVCWTINRTQEMRHLFRAWVSQGS